MEEEINQVGLRTLEDIEEEYYKYGGPDLSECEPSRIINNIRKEAIKWVKELDKHKLGNMEGHDLCLTCLSEDCRISEHPCLNSQNCESDDFIAVITFIKHFFNITDEDLK